MIRIQDRLVDEIEYILGQAERGIHVLFDQETLRRVASQPRPSDEEVELVEHILDEILNTPNIWAKKHRLSKLDARTRDTIAQMYLNILDNFVMEGPGRH